MHVFAISACTLTNSLFFIGSSWFLLTKVSNDIEVPSYNCALSPLSAFAVLLPRTGLSAPFDIKAGEAQWMIS